ncbi:MAG: metallophosphoesterase [Bythopirellula sp.]|nr:metallophosphoesterase [Bythopirellula sp.]
MTNSSLTRRETLSLLGASAIGAAAWGGISLSANAQEINSGRKRALRVAHLTDLHVQPELRATEGMATCLHHVQEHADRPQLILTGGDSIMDSYDADDARTKLQWDIWHNVLQQDCSIPVRSAIGNHDIWGWNKPSSKTTGEEPNYGKLRSTEMLKLDNRYYTFDQGGWQFIVLDSTQHHPKDRSGYTAHLDEEQYDWLAQTLRDLPKAMPVLVLSHIPIISASALLWAEQKQDAFQISCALMHTDAVKLKDLFAKHPNVKLCLSGHLHSLDRVDYNGVSYLCNGAVCGSWWKGRHKDCDEGYAVLDLYDDGSFENEYVKYGWKAEV